MQRIQEIERQVLSRYLVTCLAFFIESFLVTTAWRCNWEFESLEHILFLKDTRCNSRMDCLRIYVSSYISKSSPNFPHFTGLFIPLNYIILWVKKFFFRNQLIVWCLCIKRSKKSYFVLFLISEIKHIEFAAENQLDCGKFFARTEIKFPFSATASRFYLLKAFSIFEKIFCIYS